MIAKALRRARTRYGLFIIAALLFTAGVFGAIGLTSAIFQARFDSKTATFAGGYLAVPTIAGVLPNTLTSSGSDGVLTWTNGTDETTTANEIQQVFGADRGTTTNCTGASYSTTVLASTTSPTTTTTFTYTDSNRATTPSNINGDWYCYEVLHGWPTTTAPVWTAGATTNVQIGLAPKTVLITNGTGATAGKIDFKAPSADDTIVITYNQPVAMSAGSGASDVCSYQTEGVVLIGDTGCAGPLPTNDSYTVGKLTLPVTNSGEHKKTAATIAVSGNTIMISITAAGANVTNGSTTFVSSTSGGTVVSLATTDRVAACTTGVNCSISASGGF